MNLLDFDKLDFGGQLFWIFFLISLIKGLSYILRDFASKHSTVFLLTVPIIWAISVLVILVKYFTSNQDFAFILGVVPITWFAILLFMIALFFINEAMIYEKKANIIKNKS